MIASIVRWAIDHKKIVYSLVALLVACGLVGLKFMNKDEFPTFVIKQGLIVGVYPGADAAEVEDQLTVKLEEILYRIPEVKRENLKSVTKDGICYIYTDINCPTSKKDEVWSKIKLKLQAEKITLPAGVLGVMVLDDFNSISSILIALESSDKGYAELQEYADDLSADLRQMPNLAKIQIIGQQQEEIAVIIDKEKLSSYGLSPSSLMLDYQTTSLHLPDGIFENSGLSVPIRIKSNVSNEQEIEEKIVWSDQLGHVIRLKDIAEIKRRYKDPSDMVTYNGHSCLVLAVDMRAGNDIVTFGDQVDEILKDFMKDMPDSITVSRISDLPKVVENSVHSFLMDLVMSMLVVIAVMLSLFSMKSALIAGSGVPICTAITLAIMYFTGMDLNTVTLAALIVVLGMIVDNSIITMDGYMNHLASGKPRKEAAIASIQELFAPTLAATLAISLMFFPSKKIITGYIGDFISTFPWVILIALMVSLLYAVLVVPSMEIRHINSAVPEGKGIISKAQNALFRGLEKGYAVAERFCFRHPYLTLSFAVATVAVSVVIFMNLNVQMMPKSDRDFFAIELELESGNNLDNTREVVDSLEHILLNDKRVESVTSFMGTGAPRFVATYAPILPSKTMAQIIVNTKSITSTQSLLEEYENKYEHLFPNTIIRFKQMDYQDTEAPVMVMLRGKDREKLYAQAEELQRYMMSLDDQIKWVHSSADDFMPKIDVCMNEHEAARLGINRAALGLSMSGNFNGLNLGRVMENNKGVDINLYPGEVSDTMDFNNIGNQMIPTMIPGVCVPLRQIAGITPEWQHTTLERYNGEDAITILADLKTGVSQPAVMKQIDCYVEDRIRPKLDDESEVEYLGLSASNKGLIPEIILAVLAAIAVLIVFMVLHFKKVSLAILTLVMSLLCFFGAFFGLWIFKLDFGITAVLGLISLIGIIVRNGIIMYEYAEELRFGQGYDVKTAAMLAGARRMKPIFLTSATTALGVLPMLVSKDLLWQPMGVVICFGTILSILLIVLVMPVSYWQVFKHQDKKTGEKENEI